MQKEKISANPNPPSLSLGCSRNGKDDCAWTWQEANTFSKLRNLPQTVRTPGKRPPPAATPRTFMCHMRLNLSLSPLSPYAFIPGSGTGYLKEKLAVGLFSAAVLEPLWALREYNTPTW